MAYIIPASFRIFVMRIKVSTSVTGLSRTRNRSATIWESVCTNAVATASTSLT